MTETCLLAGCSAEFKTHKTADHNILTRPGNGFIQIILDGSGIIFNVLLMQKANLFESLGQLALQDFFLNLRGFIFQFR